MKSKLFVLLVTVSVLVMLSVACAAPAPAPAEQPKEEAMPAEQPKEAEQPAEIMKEATFVGAWPYQVPPVGHFNRWVPNNLQLGIYDELMEQSLAMYKWASDTWIPLLATGWELVPPDQFKVTLREGVKWSDGTDFTSKDIVTTYNIAHLMNNVAWRFLDRVEVEDDHHVTFYMKEPSTVVQRYVLRELNPVATSVYGEWSDKVQALLDAGKVLDSEEANTLRQDFSNFRPAEQVVSGPFKIDPASITEAQLTLVKVPTAWDADQVAFDKVVLYNGETPTVTPIVLAKEVDYATHGFPPATEKQFQSEGIRVLRPPVYSGPALYFNYDIYPLNVKEVRQAIAYAVDRDENAIISLAESAKGPKLMTGFPDSMASLWMSEADIARLNRYEYDPAKGEEILLGLGFKRDSDSVWIDDQGKRMEYELLGVAEFADWSASAENLAEQLTKFGIKTTVRAVTFTQQPTEVNQGRFQLAIRNWGPGANPHPHFAYVEGLLRFNGGAPGAGESPGPGMKFPLIQNTDVVGEFDFEQATVAAGQGLDIEQQKQTVTNLALAFNEVLPIIPLYERFGNNPTLDGVRVTGWPPDGDPIYLNSPYGDSFVIELMLEGTLMPVQ